MVQNRINRICSSSSLKSFRITSFEPMRLPSQPTETLAPWTFNPQENCIQRPLFGFEPVMHSWNLDWNGTGEPYIAIKIKNDTIDSKELSSSIKQAWKSTRMQFPDLGSFVFEGPDGSPGLKFKPLCNQEELKSWSERTLQDRSQDYASNFDDVERVLLDLRTKLSRRPSASEMLGEPDDSTPMAKLSFVSGNQGGVSVLFLEFCHQIADLWQGLRILDFLLKELVSESAYGSVSRKLSDILFDGSESTKVSLHALDVLKLGKDYCRTPVDPILLQHVMTPKIGLPISSKFAGKAKKWPQSTSEAFHLIVSRDVSLKFFSLCKQNSVSITYAIGAALLVGCFSVSRKLPDSEPLLCGIPCSMNIRSFLSSESDRNRIACGGEASTLLASTQDWDQSLAKGESIGQAQISSYWTYAESLQSFFVEHLNKPELLASQSTHDLLSGYTKAGTEMNRGLAPNPTMTGFGVNCIGKTEKYLGRSYQSGNQSLQVELLKMGFRPGGTLTAPHSYTFNDELNFNFSFMPEIFDEEKLVMMVTEAVKCICRITEGNGTLEFREDQSRWWRELK